MVHFVLLELCSLAAREAQTESGSMVRSYQLLSVSVLMHMQETSLRSSIYAESIRSGTAKSES